ncbi:unnamed protein product, partial [Rotaria sordida]
LVARRNSAPNDSYPRQLGQWLVNLLIKYWIFVSCGILAGDIQGQQYGWADLQIIDDQQ